MLKTESTNMNMSGNISNNEIIIASVGGNFNGGEDLYFHVNIGNYADLIANKEMFYADLQAFVDQMLGAVVDLKE